MALLIAWDSETTLIPDRPKIRSRSGAEIATGPFQVPDLVLGSVAGELFDGQPMVVGPEHLEAILRDHLTEGGELVGHNHTFDILVVCKKYPHLRPLFDTAAEEGRLHDTLYLDLLVGLALGRYDRPVFDSASRVWSTPDVRSRSLDVLAQEYCGLTLDKDPAIRLCYGQFLGKPLSELPSAFRRYAEDDARATLDVYQSLRSKVAEVRGKHVLSEALQIRAALALADLDTRGVHVDRALAVRLAAEFAAQLQPLKERLVSAGLGRWEPKKGTKSCQKVSILTDRTPRALPVACWSAVGFIPVGAGCGLVPAIDSATASSESPGESSGVTGSPSASGSAPPTGSMCCTPVTTRPASILCTSSSEPTPTTPPTSNGKVGATRGAGRGQLASGWVSDGAGMIHRVKRFSRHVVTEMAQPEFRLNIRALQQALAPYDDPDDPAPRRADGTVSLDADYWGGASLPKEAGVLHDFLTHEKVKKIVATYLSVYSQCDVVFPKWHVVGARSGRMAAARPSLHNIPKRRAGIRALFVPSLGRVFVIADYNAQEMFTLCESMLNMGIIGPLYTALTSGEDFHRLGAALVLGKDPKDVTKEERQAQKALHFGVPGGLGAKKLAAYAYSGYGVDWSVDEAKARRARFLDVYTDIQEFLRRLKLSQDECLRRVTGEGKDEWAQRLGTVSWNVIKVMTFSTDPAIQAAGLEAERQLCVELGSGRQRGHCRFTEGANTYFQGPASDVTKTAVWKAYRHGLQVVLVVHDEIVIESSPEQAAQDSDTLVFCMKDAFREICPRMGAYAGVEVKCPLTRWGPATDLAGKELCVLSIPA